MNFNDLENARLNRANEQMNSENEIYFMEARDAFQIIKKFADNPSDKDENDLFKALEQISNYLKTIQDTQTESISQFEVIIPSLIQIFLELDDKSDKNTIFLDLFHRITSILPNEKIREYFSNKSLCDKLLNFISPQSNFSNSSSRVVSHLIISNTITDFYDIPDFLNKAEHIDNLSDRSFYLYTLPEISLPSELFFDFLQIALNTFDINEYESVNYCCQSICNCIEDEFESENKLPLDQLNDLFEPFLLSLQPELASCFNDKKMVKPIVQLFECLFDNKICTQFFSNEDFVDFLYKSSVEVLMKNEKDGEYFFQIIFPLFSDIVKRCRIIVSEKIISTVISVAMEGTFKVRESAFLFIADIFDQISMENPEYIDNVDFYNLLFDMASSSIDDIMNQFTECLSKLLSSQSKFENEDGDVEYRQTNFIQFLKELPDGSFEEFMTELDRIQNEATDSEICNNIIFIKRILEQSMTRPYEKKL